MPFDFTFPDVGEGIHEGTIQKWLVKEGDTVTADAPMAEVETDKAVVEMPAPKSGKILKRYFKEGDIVKVGETLVTILEEGESASAAPSPQSPTPLSSPPEAPPSLPTPPPAAAPLPEKKEEHYTGSVVGFLEEAQEVAPIIPSPLSSPQSVPISSIKATPAVRNLAKQKGVDLAKIKGSGQGGIITAKDVEAAVNTGTHEITATTKASEHPLPAERVTVAGTDSYGVIERQKLAGIRKVIADKMSKSLYTAPQVTNMNDADATELVALRESQKPVFELEKIKLTFMPYFIKAVQIALAKNPELNASVEGDEIILKKYYNIGVATDTDAGLMVPVIKAVDTKSLKDLAKELDTIVEKSRTRSIDITDLKGGTFTISNLGSIGVEYFTPIVNYPEVAIVGIGRLVEKPIVSSGKILVRKIIPLSLSYDHRAVDGAHAARFMKELVYLLEHPQEIAA